MRFLFFILTLGMIFCCNDLALAKKHKSKRASSVAHKTQKHRVAKHSPARAAAISVASIYGTPGLVNELNRIINVGNNDADVAVYVKSMQGGEVLFTRNINQPMTPASTLKVLTAEAALIFLGPEYKFSTQLLTDAKEIKNGVLQGNLYVVLSGDPSLTFYDIADLLITLKSQQITGVSGNVYIDNTAYDQSFYGPGWIWKDKNYCYGAPISASIINHNCLSFAVAPSKVAGRPAEVLTSPKFFYPTIKNSVITKAGRSSGCNVRLSSEPGSVITIDGCMAKGHDAWGVSFVVSNIPEYNRALFKSLLKQLSVNVSGTVTFGVAPSNSSLIGQHASKPLKMLITDMLKKSDNIIAGALFKKLGQLYSHQPGSWENGGIAVSQILSKQAGVNTAGMRVLDGSGLSPDNLTTPAQLMQVLDFAYHHYLTSYEFISALPIAGVDGTLKHRMGHLAHKVRAKTGTISGVVSLAGYTVSAEKEPIAFVIMVNGNKGQGWQYRELEDRIVTAITRYARGNSVAKN